MIRFMGINLGLLFVALMAVVGGIVYKSRIAAPAPQGANGFTVTAGGMVEGTISLPAGARIVSQSLSGERIALLVEGPGGAQAVYVFDLAARRIVGRFEAAQE